MYSVYVHTAKRHACTVCKCPYMYLYLKLPLCFVACQHRVGMATVLVNQMWAHRSQVAGRNSNSASLCRRIYNKFSSNQTALGPLPCEDYHFNTMGLCQCVKLFAFLKVKGLYDKLIQSKNKHCKAVTTKVL